MRESDWRAEDLAKVTYLATEEAPDSYLAGWQRGTRVEGWRVEGRLSLGVTVWREASGDHFVQLSAGVIDSTVRNTCGARASA